MTKNKILKVAFSSTPKVRIRVIATNNSAELTRDKKKFPFKLDEDVVVTVYVGPKEPEKSVIKGLKFGTPAEPINGNYKFSFSIRKGYKWNGADIPKPLWWVGSSKDNAYLIASLVHDWLLENKAFVFNDILHGKITVAEFRRLTSLIFRRILKDTDTNTVKANIMSGVVNFFQKTLNRGSWGGLEE